MAPPSVGAEDVGRATRVLAVGPDHDGGAVDRHGAAEEIARAAASLAVSLATWSYVPQVLFEDVDRARGLGAGVVVVGPDHDGAAVDRHGDAEVVARRGVAGRQLGQLGAVARS